MHYERETMTVVKKEPDLLANLAEDQQKTLLRKNWQYHDAKWQMAVFQQLGVEKGNQINQAVAREMGRVEMYRLANLLGIKSIGTIEDLRILCASVMNLCHPPPAFDYHFEVRSDTEMVGVMDHCATYENVQRAGVESMYECGCFALRSGWYAALDLDVEELGEKCLKTGDEACEICIHVRSWDRKE